MVFNINKQSLQNLKQEKCILIIRNLSVTNVKVRFLDGTSIQLT
jgi:hypothetical protein